MIRKHAELRFRRQWALLVQDPVGYEGWLSARLNQRYVLSWQKDLSVSVHPLADGVLYLLGVCVWSSGSPSPAQWRAMRCDEVGGALIPAAGNYVVVAAGELKTYIYTDPGALMPVYHSGVGASSSPSLLPGAELDLELMRKFPLQGTDDWYTGSFCHFHGVRALIANHRLEVESGKSERFWPLQDWGTIEFEHAIARAADELRRICVGLHQEHNVVTSITGGKDSRVNLAALSGTNCGVRLFTLRGGIVKACDISIAKKLADVAGIQHQYVDLRGVDAEISELFDEITGSMALGARRSVIGSCLELGGADVVHLNGNLGAIAKAYYWRQPVPTEVRFTDLLHDFTRRPDFLVRGAQEWVDSLPATIRAPTALNLMYMEQRGGRWMAPGENGGSLAYAPFSAFCSRELFGAICSLEPDAQYGKDLHVAIIRQLEPKLLDIEFCKRSRDLASLIPNGSLKTGLRKMKRWWESLTEATGRTRLK